MSRGGDRNTRLPALDGPVRDAEKDREFPLGEFRLLPKLSQC